MASQVLSGSSNPSYINNTGQNVRVVINYMAGTTFVPPRFGFPSDPTNLNAPVQLEPAVPSTITINWAGVSATSSSRFGNITIGRNLAYSAVNRDQPAQSSFPTSPGTLPISSYSYPIDALVENSAIAAVANNAAGQVDEALPIELILAPGQTFSAVCGVHNIVVIPELG